MATTQTQPIDNPYRIILRNVRLAFPQLWEAKTVNGEGKPSYSAVFLLDAADAQVAKVNAMIDKVAKDKWGAKADAQIKAMRGADRVCLHDGDLKSQYAGFEGNLYVSARSSIAPEVVDADKSPLGAASGRPYSGCYVNAIIDLYAQDNSYGKRINAVLGAVQFLRDGEAFAGGRRVSADAFDDVSEGATADDLV